MSNIYDWDKNPDGNHDADELATWREGMAPRQVNNSARGMMARIKQAADDALYNHEPVVGATNLRVTLEQDFADYVDGMIVRFRCQNDIPKVPDNALLCITNIPVNKRGNNGDGLPMVMMSWDRKQNGLRVKQATGDMFVPGAHVQAVYSAIHKIWTGDAYTAEQKAERHLGGDTMALLKTDPQWQKYADDRGVFFVYTDSNMAEIQKMIDGTVSDKAKEALYGCTSFPIMNSTDFTNPIIPLAIAKKVCKEGDKDCPADCMVIVQNPQTGRDLAYANEGSIFNDNKAGAFPEDTSTCYSVRGLADALRPQNTGNIYPFMADYKVAITTGSVDSAKLNRSLCCRLEIELASPLSYLELNLIFIITAKQTYAESINSASYINVALDGRFCLASDFLIQNGFFGLNAFKFQQFDTVINVYNVDDKGITIPLSKGKHTLEYFVFPQTDSNLRDGTSLWLERGRILGGTVRNYRFHSFARIPLL